MNTRKIILKLHLWVGLPSGLILAIVGLTGSLYVFQPEINAWVNPELLLPQKNEVRFAGEREMFRYIEQETGGEIESFQWPLRERRTYMFKLFGDDDWFYLDQSTGTITRTGGFSGNAFFDFILNMHTTLTMGEAGRWITATSSLLLAIVLVLTGLYLWWPRNKNVFKTAKGLKSRFAITFTKSKKRLNYDLHNVLGFYLSIPLFLMAITGAYFIYDEEIQWVLDTVTFSERSAGSIWNEEISSTPVAGAKPLTIYDALKRMEELYPQYLRRNLWMTDDPTGYINLAFQESNTVEAGPQLRIFVSIDRYTGEVLRDSNPKNLPRGARLTELWLLPVHFGEFGGLLTRIIWFIGGLMPTVLIITGFIIWRNKK